MNTRLMNTSTTAMNLSNNNQPLPNIPRQFSMVFSSDPTTGAVNISNSSIDAGSRFTLNLPYPISVFTGIPPEDISGQFTSKLLIVLNPA